MDGTVGVRFHEASPLTWCSPGDLDLGVGDYVVVRTDRGDQLGWVVLAPDQLLAAEPEGPRRVIERLATEDDVTAWREARERAREDISRAQAIAAREDPRVRVANVVYNLAGTRAHITFSAPERVEHRWLRDACADLFDVQATVEQVGDRERARSLGDVGVCGLALCCKSWQTTFPNVSMRLAREQDLPPNPTKISGVCGRLLCCLSFEVEEYRELRGTLPKVGKRVTTPAGRAKVISVGTLKQTVRLRMDETNEVVEMSAEELASQYGTAVRPEELDATVEERVRRQDRDRRDNLVATLEPVTRPSDEGQRPGATQEPGQASGEERPKRRRRGRRGGRRRRGRGGGGGQGSGGTGGSSSE
ncbi:MAG: regulatory iron-sulfur-containing complex subunit RicT [Chloroflexi bacterium]|nr:regulatory iron-sulfur-containing complex subunit RicT [Chloroflexota bacterium]